MTYTERVYDEHWMNKNKKDLKFFSSESKWTYLHDVADRMSDF